MTVIIENLETCFNQIEEIILNKRTLTFSLK